MERPEGTESVPRRVWTLSYNKREETGKFLKAKHDMIRSER